MSWSERMFTLPQGVSEPGPLDVLDRPGREEVAVAKKGRKRRTRRKNKANHGKRPNAGRK
jgi:hypothetical protein